MPIRVGSPIPPRFGSEGAASFYVNDIQIGTTYAYSSAPSINAVFITSIIWGNGGTFDNFTLTASAVPEPSTYAALAGAAALGLAAWRRRQRAGKA
jgi:hypothetical protein